MIEFFSELVSLAMDAVTQGTFAALIALFAVAAFTEISVPFPLVIDAALFMVGYGAGVLSARPVLIMLALLLGRLAGATVIYMGFRLVDKPLMKFLCRRFPALNTQMNSLRAKLNTKGALAVAVARLTPGLLTPASVAAACVRLRWDYFAYGIALSSIIADAAIIMFGFAAGRGLVYLGVTPPVWLAGIGFAAAMILFWYIRRRLRSRALAPTVQNQG